MGTLRFILALSVIAGHSSAIFGLNLVPCSTAVQVFYIISGFYMSLILNEKYVSQPHAGRLFLTNRFLRLFPIYWVILALTFLFFALAYPASSPAAPETTSLDLFRNYFSEMKWWSALFLVFANVFLFFQDAVMFLGLDPATGNLFFARDFHTTHPELHRFLLVPQAWTIGVELLFYLIAPFVVRRGVAVIATLIVFSIGLRVLLYHSGLHHDPWTYRFFPTELVYFLFGNIAYVLYRNIRDWRIPPVCLNTLWAAVFLASVFYSNVDFPGKKILYCLAFSLALPFIFLRTKNLKLDAYIGELSYPLYLCHMLLLAILYWTGFSSTRWLGLTLAVTSILFSVALNEFVAKRIEKIRQKRVNVLAVT